MDPARSSLSQYKAARQLLRFQGTFPSEHRAAFYIYLLELPLNETEFSVFEERADQLSKEIPWEHRFPMQSNRLSRRFYRALSTMTAFNADLGQTLLTAKLIFPFVKLFKSNRCATFEGFVTFLKNWCFDFYSTYPHPPVGVLSSIDKIIGYFSPNLLKILTSRGISAVSYTWNMLSTLFSEQFPSKEFLQLFDHIIINRPSFLFFLAAAVCLELQSEMVQCQNTAEMDEMFSRNVKVSSILVLKRAYQILKDCPTHLQPREQTFTPLETDNMYSLDIRIAPHVIDYDVHQRQKIVSHEKQKAKQETLLAELEDMVSSAKVNAEVHRRELDNLGQQEEELRLLRFVQEQARLKEIDEIEDLNRQQALMNLHLKDQQRAAMQSELLKKKKQIVERMRTDAETNALITERALENRVSDAALRKAEIAANLQDYEVFVDMQKDRLDTIAGNIAQTNRERHVVANEKRRAEQEGRRQLDEAHRTAMRTHLDALNATADEQELKTEAMLQEAKIEAKNAFDARAVELSELSNEIRAEANRRAVEEAQRVRENTRKLQKRMRVDLNQLQNGVEDDLAARRSRLNEFLEAERRKADLHREQVEAEIGELNQSLARDSWKQDVAGEIRNAQAELEQTSEQVYNEVMQLDRGKAKDFAVLETFKARARDVADRREFQSELMDRLDNNVEAVRDRYQGIREKTAMDATRRTIEAVLEQQNDREFTQHQRNELLHDVQKQVDNFETSELVKAHMMGVGQPVVNDGLSTPSTQTPSSTAFSTPTSIASELSTPVSDESYHRRTMEAARGVLERHSKLYSTSTSLDIVE
ncbi:hypothetical protein PCE1_002111 [Barthelona sp. PCE]